VIIILTIVSGALAKLLLKHENLLFQSPNVLSMMFLVLIWALLYLRSGAVVGLRNGVNKYGLHAYP